MPMPPPITPEHFETIRELARANVNASNAPIVQITLAAALQETINEIDRLRADEINRLHSEAEALIDRFHSEVKQLTDELNKRRRF